MDIVNLILCTILDPWEGEDPNVEDEMQDVVDGEAAHQEMEISHNLQKLVLHVFTLSAVTYLLDHSKH